MLDTGSRDEKIGTTTGLVEYEIPDNEVQTVFIETFEKSLSSRNSLYA